MSRLGLTMDMCLGPAGGTTPIPPALLISEVRHLYYAPWEGAPPESIADRAQNAGLTAGDPLAVLTDWSDAALHLEQAIAGNQPTWETSGAPDGDGAVFFDGSDALLSPGSVELWDVSVLAVYQSTTAAERILVEHGSNGASAGWYVVTRYNAPINWWAGRGAGAPTATSRATSLGLPLAYHTIEWDGALAAAARDVRIDGASILESTSGDASAAGPGPLRLRLGARVSAGGSVSFGAQGYLRGMAIVDASISSADRAVVIDQLTGGA